MIIIGSIVVFVLAILEIWLAVPLGFVFGLNPWLIFILSSLGGVLGVWIAGKAGEKISTLISQFTGQNYFTQEERLVVKIWRRGGKVAFGLLAPLMSGPLVGGIFAIVLSGGQDKKSLIWVALGTIILCAVMSMLIALGVWVFTH